MKARPTVVSIVGARPQFVKLAPLAAVLARRFRHLIVHTGQHYDDNMSGVFFKQLRIPEPHMNLEIGGGTHGKMTGRMLIGIEKLLLERKPEFVLVFGDTNSTLAGALAAVKLGVPVGHVEAGMRSFVDDMPEEINRRLSDHISSILFCPTAASMKNLRNEGVTKRIVDSGDLMFELLHERRTAIKNNLGPLKKRGLRPSKYCLLTAHRAANVDNVDNLTALVEIIESLPDPVLFPVHPRTRKRLRDRGLWRRLEQCERTILTEPLGYLDLLAAARHARVVLTDSGGLQKEAVFLGSPVLTLRDETEWVETLTQGNRLVGLDRLRVLRRLRTLSRPKRLSYRVKGRKPSEIVAGEIQRHLKGR